MAENWLLPSRKTLPLLAARLGRLEAMTAFPEGAVDVTTLEGARAAAERISPSPEVAVDVEADAMHAFRARLCFVQVGTDQGVWLFDTLAEGVRAEALAAIFADPERTKFFHAAGGDLQYLAEAGIRVKGLFDTHRAATLLGWPRVGLADLARDLVQVELPKEHQQSDFSIRPLPASVHEYIANDVRYLCEIGRRVRQACRDADIAEEVELDCERLADDALARPEVGSDYRPKLPRGSMRPAQLALAQAIAAELHRLRLLWAEAADVPIGRMLSNAAIAAVATHPPSSIKDLARAQGVRGAFAREHGEEVLAAMRTLIEKSRGGALGDPAPNPNAQDPKRRKRSELLKVFRAQKAAERKVTPSVVLSNSLVDELAASPPADLATLSKVPYFGEKRLRLYGQEIIGLLVL
jgi:ribonuclease D